MSEIRKLADLTLDPKNPRKRGPRAEGMLVASLQEVGAARSIVVDEDGRILAGNGTVQAAAEAGIERVQVVDADGETLVAVRRSGLTEAQKRRLAVLDNRTGELAEWDAEVLASLVDEGLDLSDLWRDEELAELLAQASAALPEGPISGTVAEARKTLAERFLVPPFSVLDARQGYWQARKRAWIALGIQSELGRGAGVTFGDSPEITEPGLNHYRRQNAEPGGSKRDACSLGEDGKTRRGDGKGKPVKGGLTWVKSGPRTDETSAKILRGGRKVRGAYPVTGSAANETRSILSHNADRAAGNGLLGESEQARSHYKNGGPARSNGQDIMKGENANFRGAERSPQGEYPYPVDELQAQSGTSIFDPVLCELAYRWFCPPDGLVLDPFAGGSVRGIVAAVLGRQYVGIDLSPVQLAANAVQADRICSSSAVVTPTDTVRVKVSAASARLLFHPCEPGYIRDVCHANCCRSSTQPNGTLVTIHPSEEAAIAAMGGTVRNGRLEPRKKGTCHFQGDDGLCALHGMPEKPFGCIASPFTLTPSGTLILRNRYKALKCYKDEGAIPAYQAHRGSLERIFGTDEAARICEHLDGGGGDLLADMPRRSYQMLLENDEIKHGRLPGETAKPRWIEGDARDVATLAQGEYDFLFSCPPYADLEVYSDDPRDLSTLDYAAFLAAYRRIIAESVALLKPDRFACFCVGDVRDTKTGLYRNFVSDTIAAFHAAGARLYNEAILVTACGSLPIRAGKQFSAYRKLGKTHQNVLVFIKGNVKAAVEACGEVDVTDALNAVSPDTESGDGASWGTSLEHT